MANKLSRKRGMGWVFLLAGVGLLFVGAAGAFNLFESARPSEFVGEEVPRDMIESAYIAGETQPLSTPQGQEGSEPFYIPAEADVSEVLPTLEPVSAAELPASAESARVPTELPDGLEQYKEDYQQQIVAGEDIGAEPLWIYIDKIALEAPITPATSVTVEMTEGGKTYEFVQWEAPDEFAVGWHTSSARLGKLGNTVLNGHHNVYGRVFRNLVYLQEGDFIQVYGSDGKWYTYVVANKMVLPEWNVPLETRIENAAWTLPSQDERLTLITCWPEQSASHRLIIVARPVY